MGNVESPKVRAALGVLGTLASWLVAAVDPEQLRESIGRHEPRLAVQRVAATRLRLDDGGGAWTGRYQVTLGGQAGAMRDVALMGTLRPPGAAAAAFGAPAAPFGSPGWRRVLPELGLELAPAPTEEAALPALETLTDPERARALLEREIAAAPTHHGFRLTGCTPRVVRYKPGSRCTILYDLAYPSGTTGPPLVVAKTYRGDKGRNAWEGMRSLWTSPLATGDVVTIAEPLAYVPELRLLLQGPVPERATLKRLIRSALDDGTPRALAELDAAIDRTAVGLAALHTSRAAYGEPVTIADELRDIRTTLSALAVSMPELPSAATPLLDLVAARAARQPADAAAPTHHSFRPGQVLLDGDHVGFIDFDGMCQAEPALDVALFLSSIKGVGLVEARGAHGVASEQRLTQLDRLCSRFLERYKAVAPISHARVSLWEALYLLTDVVDTWVKVQPDKVAPAMLLLERHLEASGLV